MRKSSLDFGRGRRVSSSFGVPGDSRYRAPQQNRWRAPSEPRPTTRLRSPGSEISSGTETRTFGGARWNFSKAPDLCDLHSRDKAGMSLVKHRREDAILANNNQQPIHANTNHQPPRSQPPIPLFCPHRHRYGRSRAAANFYPSEDDGRSGSDPARRSNRLCLRKLRQYICDRGRPGPRLSTQPHLRNLQEKVCCATGSARSLTGRIHLRGSTAPFRDSLSARSIAHPVSS